MVAASIYLRPTWHRVPRRLSEPRIRGKHSHQRFFIEIYICRAGYGVMGGGTGWQNERAPREWHYIIDTILVDIESLHHTGKKLASSSIVTWTSARLRRLDSGAASSALQRRQAGPCIVIRTHREPFFNETKVTIWPKAGQFESFADCLVYHILVYTPIHSPHREPSINKNREFHRIVAVV